MDSNQAVFLGVMIAVVAVGILAFLILLIARRAERTQDGGSGQPDADRSPKWYVILLAVLLLVVVALLLIWLFAPSLGQGAATDWPADPRSLIFFVVMVVVGGLALLAFLVYLFSRGEGQATAPAPAAAAQTESGSETSSGARVGGLWALALAVLVLSWTYVPRAQQYGLMVHLIYPASLAVALVLLFDKATRAWSTKSRAETVREWLFCDAIVFLLVLGFLNVMASGGGETYAALILDLVYIVLFFFTFWMLDRTLTRYRFLVAHGYLVVLAILLLIWRAVQGEAAPEGLSWWATIWPFFFLAIIFLVFEIIALVATANADRPVVPAIKDAVFLALYGVLLLIAIPATGE